MPSPGPRGVYLSTSNGNLITGENPLPVSGEVSTTVSVTTEATNLQYGGVAVTGERPLPISGGVELYGSISTTSTATNLQVNDVTVTG